METFGEWLQQQRSQRRLTREEFAKHIGCSVSALKKIEYGVRRPSAQIAELMANCLDVPLEERSTFVRVARGELSVDRLHVEAESLPTEDVPAPKVNLPLFPTPLIGREHEMEQLCQLLRDPQCRLLTLVGPGGIGKTRLAIETASNLQDVFANGVYFVPLASANSTRFIVPVIADSIGFSFQSATSADPKTQLLNYLREKQVLLLIDNIEHLLKEPGVELLAELLEVAPGVKLLITSRESLSLPGEWVFEVHGLPIPEGETTQDTSVELFLQRARRAHVGFNATNHDYPAILRICKLVDGMPLAIELAAAWVRVLSCREIAQEIEHSLDFLSGSARGLPARHRSMRAVFDHSWKLLTEEEQSIVCRLSIFQGGFQREAAEQVTGASLSVLSALLTKSLVYRSSEGRYDLHELIRQYALEKLVDQPRVHKETVARHGVYYMKYLAKEDERLRGTTQREALTELTAEIENIRRAQDWALINHKFTLIEGAMRAYLVFYDALGWAKEALDTLGRIINTLESIREKSPLSETEELALAHTLSARSLFAFRVSQHEQARAMLDQSLEILRRLNEPRVLVEALTFLGIVTTIMGDPARASELFKEGLQTATAIGDHWFSALCLTELVGTTVMIGKAENAHEQFQSAVAAWRTTGDLRFTAFGLNFLSLSAVAVGKYEEARGALKESIAISTSIGDRWSLGNSYRGLGLIAQAQGEHSQALDAFHKSCDIFDELGARWDIARVLSDMGRSIFALGNDSEAAHTWREAIRIATETQGMLVVQDAMVGFAGLHAKHGNAKYALELLLVVLHHPATVQETKNRASLLRPGVQAQLTPEEIQSAQRLAESKKFESLVEAILDQAWKG